MDKYDGVSKRVDRCVDNNFRDVEIFLQLCRSIAAGLAYNELSKLCRRATYLTLYIVTTAKIIVTEADTENRWVITPSHLRGYLNGYLNAYLGSLVGNGE